MKKVEFRVVERAPERVDLEEGAYRAEVFKIRVPGGSGWWNATILKMPGRKSQAFIEYMKTEETALRVARAVLQELTKDEP